MEDRRRAGQMVYQPLQGEIQVTDIIDAYEYK
jgi:hypothetical protein